MKYLNCILVGCLTLNPLRGALAGDYYPHTNAVYTLTLQSSNTTYSLTESDLKWQNKLSNRLHIQEWLKQRGHTVMTFVLTNHRCVLNGKEPIRVYMDRNDPDTLIVLGPTLNSFVIHLREKSVGAGCGSGFMHPSGNFTTIFNNEKSLSGVRVWMYAKNSAEEKANEIGPIFRGNLITWW